MNNIRTEGYYISKPPCFNGRHYPVWKEHIKMFIISMDFNIWLVIKNGVRIPTKIVNDEEVEKNEDEYDEEDIKNLQLEAKAKMILYCALNPDIFEIFSEGPKSSKQMWDELEREMTCSTPPLRRLSYYPTATYADADSNSDADSNENLFNFPDLSFLFDTRESQEKFLKHCVPLHKCGLEGNWAGAKVILEKDERLKHAAIATGWATLLHVAASANHVSFVKELLEILTDEHLRLQDMKGKTAFCFAVASGNMPIVKLLIQRDPHLPRIRDVGGHTPIQFALMDGKFDMAHFLYHDTIPIFKDRDKKSLFFASIKNGNYHLALRMAREWRSLAWARDQNDDTALHLLALHKNPLDSCSHSLQIPDFVRTNPGMKKLVIFQLVKFLWLAILDNFNLQGAIEIISNPSQALFDAAEVGNFGFLSELISANPSLIWEVDDKNQSIIHTAVSYRHANIFNLLHEIGSHKDIIVRYIVKDNPSSYLPKTKNNSLLHMAAKLATPDRLELVSGAAFQMCLEITWFEEVKKIMPPSYIRLRNSDNQTAQELFTLEHEGYIRLRNSDNQTAQELFTLEHEGYIRLRNSDNQTAQELFTLEHEGLRKEGEVWMKRTAEFCMLIATVIATAVFSAAINIPGGIDQSKKPNFMNKTSFLVFVISDAGALIFSATAILIFLSILTSRYAMYDFHKSLPVKLICGLITLYISIAFMMVAFCSSIFITYTYGFKMVPDLIAIVAGLPLLLYIVLQYSLWRDIIYSTLYCRTLFTPNIRMIYTEVEEL